MREIRTSGLRRGRATALPTLPLKICLETPELLSMEDFVPILHSISHRTGYSTDSF